jgi:hypothetical protein
MKTTISVFGSAQVKKDSTQYIEAQKIGAILGRRGFDLLCGGFGGVMEAVCRGAIETGAKTTGVGLNSFTASPNSYIDKYLSVEDLSERLEYFRENSSLILGMPGGIGTLTEVMFFWDMSKAGLETNRDIFLYGNCWKKLITQLKENFIIKDKCFDYVRLFSKPTQLEAYLKNIS